MSLYSQEQHEEHKAIVRRIMAMRPTITLRQIRSSLMEAKTPITLGLPYIMQIVRDIRTERVRAVEEETKEDIYAMMRDAVEYVNQQLRAIAQEEKLVYMNDKMSPESRTIGQSNRIKAMNSIIDNLMKLVNLKMDLGIIERKVGTLDHNIISVMQAIKRTRNGDYTTPITDLIRIPAAAPDGGAGEEGGEDRA